MFQIPVPEVGWLHACRQLLGDPGWVIEIQTPKKEAPSVEPQARTCLNLGVQTVPLHPQRSLCPLRSESVHRVQHRPPEPQ